MVNRDELIINRRITSLREDGDLFFAVEDVLDDMAGGAYLLDDLIFGSSTEVLAASAKLRQGLREWVTDDIRYWSDQ